MVASMTMKWLRWAKSANTVRPERAGERALRFAVSAADVADFSSQVWAALAHTSLRTLSRVPCPAYVTAGSEGLPSGRAAAAALAAALAVAIAIKSRGPVPAGPLSAAFAAFAAIAASTSMGSTQLLACLTQLVVERL